MEAKKKDRETIPPLVAASAAVIAAVLGNEDLLGEILLRLGFPTCLVRAAAVCKKWLKVASDPDFLERFRALHPPRLLGFFVVTGSYPCMISMRFVSMELPPELAFVVRRGIHLRRDSGIIYDCRNDRVLEGNPQDNAMMCRLHPGQGPAVLPDLPKTNMEAA